MKIYLEIFWYGVFFGWVPQRVYTHNGWIHHTLDEYFALNPVKTECKEKRRRDCALVNDRRERESAIFRSIKIFFFFVLFLAGSVAAVVLVWRKFFVDSFFLKISLFCWGSRRIPIVRLCFCCGSWGEGRGRVKKRRWIGAMWRRRSLWMLSRKWSGPRRQGHCRNSFRSLPPRRLNPNGTLALNATFTSKSPSLLPISSSSSSSSSFSSSFVCVCVRACVVHLTLRKILLM